MHVPCESSDLLVFSHHRWDQLFHRPQHLFTRYAKYRRVFFVESPIFGMTEIPRLFLKETTENVLTVVPHLPHEFGPMQMETLLADLVDELIYEEELIDFTVWYDSPKAWAYTQHLTPEAVIYDCDQDHDDDKDLMARANIVFASSPSLCEKKEQEHSNVHSCPSAINHPHFKQARLKLTAPDDQINIPHPRIGFYGNVDEKLNTHLISEMAKLRPDFHFIILGPCSNSKQLPKAPNIHYLGQKDYYSLPLYLAGWDCTMMPYHTDESTQYMYPAKILEFIAAGKPVVSTMLKDIVNPYVTRRLIHVAEDSIAFIQAIEAAMEDKKNPEWIDRVDHFLKDHSWDQTFSRMAKIEEDLLKNRHQISKINLVRPLTTSEAYL